MWYFKQGRLEDILVTKGYKYHIHGAHLGYKFTLRLRMKDLGIEGCPHIELVGQASTGRVA